MLQEARGNLTAFGDLAGTDRSLAVAHGKVDHGKKAVLALRCESSLGGSNPYRISNDCILPRTGRLGTSPRGPARAAELSLRFDLLSVGAGPLVGHRQHLVESNTCPIVSAATADYYWHPPSLRKAACLGDRVHG